MSSENGKKRPTRTRIGKRHICGHVLSLHWHSVPKITAGAEYTGPAVEVLDWPELPIDNLAERLGIATPPSPPRRLRYRFLRLLNLEVRWEP